MTSLAILGAAAAAVQFLITACTSGKHGIDLLKRLIETPRNLERLLDDTNKSIDRITQNSEVLKKLDQLLTDEQVGKLEETAYDAGKAMNDLKTTLDNIFSGQNQNSPNVVKRIWVSIISVHKEREIKAQLEKIKQYNESFLVQLQVCGVDVQMQTRHMVEQTKILVETGIDTVKTGFDTMKTAIEEACRMANQANLSIEQLSSQSAISHQQTYTELNRQGATFAPFWQCLVAQFGLPNSAQTGISQQPDVNQMQEGARHGSMPTSSASGPQEVLVYRNNTIFNLSLLPQPCRCRARKTKTAKGHGWVFFGFEESRTHENTCPLSNSAKYTRIGRLGFRYKNTTVELAFKVTVQGWGIHLGSSLKTVATVKRSESPIFQLFDEFADRCGVDRVNTDYLFWATTTRGLYKARKTDIEVTRRELRRVCQSLVEASMSGTGFITDRDENGRTLFHDIIALTMALAPVYPDVADEIGSLLRLGERFSVDQDAVAKPIEGTPFFHEGETVANFARTCVAHCCYLLKDLSHLRLLLSFCSPSLESPVPESDRLFRWLMPRSFNEKPLVIDALRRDPWALGYLFTGDLALAVHSRDLDRLRKVLVTANMDVDVFSCLPINVLDLAIGWPDGLRLLSTVWTHSIAAQIALASRTENWESLGILCSFPVTLIKDFFDAKHFINAMISSEARSVLIQALKHRRDGLSSFARDHLSVEEQAHFGLPKNKFLDAKAYEVYELLVDRLGSVPSYSNPGLDGSIYHYIAVIIMSFEAKFTSQEVLECLYDLFLAGFVDIDGTDTKGLSPLEAIYRHFLIFGSYEKLLDLNIWLLRMGADETFHTRTGTSNILLSIAQTFPQSYIIADSPESRSKKIGILIRYAASLVSPLELDQCTCYCSSSGCLELQQSIRKSNQCIKHRSQYIFALIRHCDLPSDDAKLYLEETVRAELFDALGMCHTCCIAPKSDQEREEIRDEDAEMQSQLELLMTAYRRFRANPQPQDCDGWVVRCNSRCKEYRDLWGIEIEPDMPKYWNWWWYQVNQILPLSNASLVHESEDDTEPQVALEEDKYEGMDFTKVIQRHFAEYLDPQQQSQDDMCTADPNTETIKQAREKFVPQKRTDLLMEVLRPYEANLSDEQRLSIEQFCARSTMASGDLP